MSHISIKIYVNMYAQEDWGDDEVSRINLRLERLFKSLLEFSLGEYENISLKYVPEREQAQVIITRDEYDIFESHFPDKIYILLVRDTYDDRIIRYPNVIIVYVGEITLCSMMLMHEICDCILPQRVVVYDPLGFTGELPAFRRN